MAPVLAALAVDVLVLIHLAFIVFVVLGALLVLRWRGLLPWHLAAVAWGAAIEFGGWICPLTFVEDALRRAAGEPGYAGGFITHYLLAVIYPAGLTRSIQIGLGLAVLVINGAAYAALVRRHRRGREPS